LPGRFDIAGLESWFAAVLTIGRCGVLNRRIRRGRARNTRVQEIKVEASSYQTNAREPRAHWQDAAVVRHSLYIGGYSSFSMK